MVVAGGSGNRLGGETPKQFLPLAGRPLVLHCLERFAAGPRRAHRAGASRGGGGARGGPVAGGAGGHPSRRGRRHAPGLRRRGPGRDSGYGWIRGRARRGAPLPAAAAAARLAGAARGRRLPGGPAAGAGRAGHRARSGEGRVRGRLGPHPPGPRADAPALSAAAAPRGARRGAGSRRDGRHRRRRAAARPWQGGDRRAGRSRESQGHHGR